MANDRWRIEGEYFESCNCELLCPCLLSSLQARPTEGHCDVVLAIHVKQGNYGATDLAGLTAVQALSTPGSMAQGNATLAVYLDSRANDAQRAAFEAIFTGAAGGPPSLFGPLITKLLPTKSTAIEFSSDGKTWKLRMPHISDVTVEGVTGAGGRNMWLDNVPHPFSTRLAVAKATKSNYTDHGMTFENSGRNGHFSAISWSNA